MRFVELKGAASTKCVDAFKADLKYLETDVCAQKG